MSNTPKYTLLTDALGDYNTRNYHFFNHQLDAQKAYDDAKRDGLVPTLRLWSEIADRAIYSLLNYLNSEPIKALICQQE